MPTDAPDTNHLGPGEIPPPPECTYGSAQIRDQMAVVVSGPG